MRIEPRICFRQFDEAMAILLQQRNVGGPLARDFGSDADRRRHLRVAYLRLVVDVIDPEFDAVLDAARLDNRHPHRFMVVFVLFGAIEDVAHREDGLERIALRAPGRRDISFAAGNADGVVEDRCDRLGLDARAVILDLNRSRFNGDRNLGGDLGFLASVEGVIDQLFENDERPLVVAVARLVLQLPQRAELHEPRDLEGHAGQSLFRFCAGFVAAAAVGLCHNL
jgi:hypothetical protein